MNTHVRPGQRRHHDGADGRGFIMLSPQSEPIRKKQAVGASRRSEYWVLVIGQEEKRLPIAGNVSGMRHLAMETDDLRTAVRFVAAQEKKPAVIVIDGSAIEKGDMSSIGYLKRGAPGMKILVLDADQAAVSSRAERLGNAGVDMVFEVPPQIDTFRDAITELMPVRFVREKK
jgi:hypothetical protein